MSSLRKLTKRINTWLIVLFLLVVFVLLDSYRSPAAQITAKTYAMGVRLYQKISRPILSEYVQCRYQPSCSDYSLEAVKKHGIRKGIVLSIKRIFSCRKDVSMGTFDPVTEKGQKDHGRILNLK